MERLLVRLLPRPSERNVFIGDVVAFNSPLTVAAAAVAGPGGAATAGLPFGGGSAAAAAAAASGLGEELQQSTMVRRVAAMPGDELTTGEEEGAESYVIPEVRPSQHALAGAAPVLGLLLARRAQPCAAATGPLPSCPMPPLLHAASPLPARRPCVSSPLS